MEEHEETVLEKDNWTRDVAMREGGWVEKRGRGRMREEEGREEGVGQCCFSIGFVLLVYVIVSFWIPTKILLI